MTSGGARARSGPPKDPNSQKSLKAEVGGKNDWTDLPVEGRIGDTPTWPLTRPTAAETRLWEHLWTKPQAVMWERLGMIWQVAHYTRNFVEATTRGAMVGVRTATLRMEAELGISPVGMRALGWRIRSNDIAAAAEAKQPAAPSSAKDRLRALNGSRTGS